MVHRDLGFREFMGGAKMRIHRSGSRPTTENCYACLWSVQWLGLSLVEAKSARKLHRTTQRIHIVHLLLNKIQLSLLGLNYFILSISYCICDLYFFISLCIS